MSNQEILAEISQGDNLSELKVLANLESLQSKSQEQIEQELADKKIISYLDFVYFSALSIITYKGKFRNICQSYKRPGVTAKFKVSN